MRIRTLFCSLIIWVFSYSADAEEKLQIFGNGSPTAGWPWAYTLNSFDLPKKANKSGYSPNIPTEFENVLNGMYQRDEEVEIRWNFGDGSKIFNSKDRINAAHTYKKPGTYNIKVSVKDENNQVINSASKEVTVKPAKPHSFFGVIPLNEDEPTRLKFDASTYLLKPPDNQILTYQWDFGDGSQKEGEDLQTVIHTYATTGTYKTKLTVTSDTGMTDTSRKKVRVIAKKPANIQQSEDGLKAPDIINNKVNLKISGSISGKIEANAKPVATLLFMAPVRDGTCQVWFNYWDDSNLVGGLFLVNLGYLPENGGNYKFTGKQRFNLRSFHDKKTYVFAKKTFEPLSKTSGFNKALHNFGEEATLSMTSGSVDLTVRNGNYIVGKINSKLDGRIGSGFPNEKRKKISIKVKGDFSVDLGNRGVIGSISNLIPCKEKNFEIVKRHPESGMKHLQMPRPIIFTRFNDNLQRESVNDKTFQVGYPNSVGNFIKIPGKIILDKKKISFIPDKRLRPGIRYTIRVKVGLHGVRSAAGIFLVDIQGTGWQETNFWTRIDFSAESSSPSNLSCDVYQTVKNAPLIEGKNALMKIYADWPAYNDVHKDAQYKDFKGKVSLFRDGKPIKTILHKYTRTDRRQGWGKPRLRNEEAAQLPFIPDTQNVKSVWIKLDNGVGGISEYHTYCSTPLWELAPYLNVAFFVLNDGRYGPDSKSDKPTQLNQQHVRQLIDVYSKKVKQYAEQLYPVKKIDIYPPVFINPPDLNLSLMNWVGKGCKPLTSQDESNRKNYLKENEKFINFIKNQKSNAHMIVVLGPPIISGGGGGTISDFTTGQGLISMTIADDSAAFERYVFGLVHEFGHALSLQHQPTVDNCSLYKLMEKRNFGTRQWYEGINGMRISADGKTWWHKSSKLGNDESIHIAPIMFPGTLQPEDAFISSHQYRKLQTFLEDYY